MGRCMRILITGGYGNISWWVTKQALELGHEVHILNREQTTSTRREIPSEVKVINIDYRDFKAVEESLENLSFDVVCDFLCFSKENAESAYQLFKHKTKQYILISTESVFKRYDIVSEKSIKYTEEEASPYILGKLQAENYLTEKMKNENFPLTVVRPGYTLDTILPYSIGHNCYTVANRYLNGKPILIAGSGENKWTFTHSSDFASAFSAVMGNPDTVGDDFNIIGDTVSTFNNIMGIFAKELVNKEPEFIHIPYKICLSLPIMPEDLMKQRMENALFDNSKIKSLAPDWKTKMGAKDIVTSTLKWLNEDERRKRINKELDEKLEKLTITYKDYND